MLIPYNLITVKYHSCIMSIQLVKALRGQMIDHQKRFDGKMVALLN